MHFLDFLNEPPRLFIFQKIANKTNFGGVLFLLYIITMILISSAYIFDYAIKEKYTYEVMTSDNLTNCKNEDQENEEMAKLNEDDKLNPLVNFTINLENLNLQFALYDPIKKEYIKEKECLDNNRCIYNINRRVSNFSLEVRYICDDDIHCSSLYNNRNAFTRKIGITYTGYELNHTGEIPLKITEDNPIFFQPRVPEYINGIINLNLNWEVIKYKDQKSLFDSLTGNTKEYIYGHIKRDYQINSNPINIQDIPKELDENIGYYVNIFNITINNYHYQYLFYQRKKVELLDLLASIGALFSTIKFFFSVAFHFYSKNFDNYKILDKVLKLQKEPIKPKELSDDFKAIFSNKKYEEKNDQGIELDNIDPLMEKSFEEKKLNNKENDFDKDIEKDINDSNLSEGESFALNKLSFIDFFFNNIYSKCCRRIRNQEIIDSVNEIIYKYLSVDILLYNQIKLESLFKDYKWNNPSLNNIHNNKMIKKLKNI